MKLTFIGSAHEVTGSCTLLEAMGTRILIDCGMEQGENTYENAPLPISPSMIDAVFLTHAHIDHSGLIPALVKEGYRGDIYSTLATKRLCDIMLMDSAHIGEQEANWKNRKAKRQNAPEFEPLYTTEDAKRALGLFKTYNYGEEFEIKEGIGVKFIDAGHLLGSASIHFTIKEDGEEKTILFSGDLGNRERPLIRNPQNPPYADYVMIESTYGDRIHGERPDYVAQLVKIMEETFESGGNLVIPSFAIGRTQELLYLFRKIKEEKLLKNNGNFSVYVDSPLAVEATKIYKDNLFDYYDDEALSLLAKGINPIAFDGLVLSITKEESIAINEDKNPKVILSASGMCEAGRIRHHLKHNLWREESTILFVGYQSARTLGRRLLEGAKSVNLFGEEISVKAKIRALAGISGHADKDILLDWLSSMGKKPKKVFVNHGDDVVCDYFAELIHNKLDINAVAPYSGDEFDLSAGVFSKKAEIVRLKKESQGRKRANLAFDRLMSAWQRLKVVIEQSRGLSNKELAKFTDQINDLCEKYVIKTKNKK